MPGSGSDPAGEDGATPSHLVTAAALYGVEATDLSSLGAFESDVYRFVGPEGPSILKVMAPGHRTTAQVQAEVDWLLALLEDGVAVSEPIRSRAGNWVERLPESGHVTVAYVQARGNNPAPADWTVPMIERWGELLGRLQAHSRIWTPPGPRRHSLADQTYLRHLDSMAVDFPAFHAAAARLLAEAAPLLSGGERPGEDAGATGEEPGPSGNRRQKEDVFTARDDPVEGAVAAAARDSGLVHADLHYGNLLLHEGSLTAIDFDDCAYGSYAFDLAMPVYYAVRNQRDLSPEAALEGFLPHLMRGFRRFAPDPAGGTHAIDLALRFRQAELVLALRCKVPEGDWSPNLVALEKDLRERVANGVPFADTAVLERCLAG